MQVSNNASKRVLKGVSNTFPGERLEQILCTPGIYFNEGHFEYPVSEIGRTGNHLDAFFLIDPILRNPQFVDWIVQDISKWMSDQKIKCNLIFAPGQVTVRTVVDKLAQVNELPVAYWLSNLNGWFENALQSGAVSAGDQALVFNAVSLTGRCIGERLPSFVQRFGAETVAAAAIAIGTTDGADNTKEKFGERLYAAIEVPLNLYAPSDCPICRSSNGARTLVPWTTVRD
jgi:hypothetical protein